MAYPELHSELDELGHQSTLSYVREAAGTVLRETGLLPHINAGVMEAADLSAFRRVSGSQGLMLETATSRLSALGMPHYACPDKVRIAPVFNEPAQET